MKELKKGDFVSYNFSKHYPQIDTAVKILEIQQKNYKLKHQKDARVNYEVERLDTNEGITIRKLDDRNVFREILIEEKHFNGLNPRKEAFCYFEIDEENQKVFHALTYLEIANITFIKSNIFKKNTYKINSIGFTGYYTLKKKNYPKEDLITEFKNYYLGKSPGCAAARPVPPGGRVQL